MTVDPRFSVVQVRGATKPYVRFRVRDDQRGTLIGHLYKQRHRAMKRADTLNQRWISAESWRRIRKSMGVR